MNSSDIPLNGLLEKSHSNNQMSTSDNNANLNNSKGAIPKTRPVKQNSSSKKPIKFNNNEDILIPTNSANLMEEVLQLHSETLRLNRYSDSLTKISGSYLEDYESVLFRSKGDGCGNCGIKTNGSVHINDGKVTNGHLEVTAPQISSYQASSSRELDVNNLLLKVDIESNSSDENELLSISDDGCIYTYKGDQAADLPRSFFSLDLPIPHGPELPTSNRLETVSPEMDFLEMDFDPGPSGDADSDSQSNADLENTENLPEDLNYSKISDSDPIGKGKVMSLCSTSNELREDRALSNANVHVIEDAPSTSSATSINTCSSKNTTKEPPTAASSITERIRKICSPWMSSMSHRTTTSNLRTYSSKRLHCSQGEYTLATEKLLSPIDEVNSIAETIEKVREENFFSESAMIWSEEEASLKQITQISASACGATAVLNVLNALRLPIPSAEVLREAIKTRLRSNSSPLTEYLLSRSVAGSTHEDLIEGLRILSDDQVYSRFFHMHPERVVNLNWWLHFWISHGAIPIATLNLQKCSGTIPDAWHHQMIYGIGPRGIYLTNPLECIEVGQLWPQLSSDSILLIRKEDVLSRWNMKTDLRHLMSITDKRWCTLNVVGQVANLVRESRRELRHGFANTTHIKIPAAYSAGITLVMKRDAPLCALLKYFPEFLLLPNEAQAEGYTDAFF
ncbi:hypothetical protein FQR65_LT04333 [Abscondita terminalis]|nr:hypothetical protein FQR65_LT04333 [Abscondita terminalis]